MLQSTEIEIKLTDVRKELRSLQTDPPANDATDEVQAEFDVKLADSTRALDDLESQKNTALKAEDLVQERALKLVAVEQRVGAGDIPNMPPEFREFMGIEARVQPRWVLRRHPRHHGDGRSRAGDASGARGERAWRDSVADADRAHSVA